MKNFTLAIICVFIGTILSAQDYEISFTAEGESSTIDSILVENITQGTSLSMPGSSVLHLIGNLDAEIYKSGETKLSIYPNPMFEETKIRFNNPVSGDVSIKIYDIIGRLVISNFQELLHGEHIFKLSGLGQGTYILQIISGRSVISAKLISRSTRGSKPAITYMSDKQPVERNKLITNNKNLVQMQYNPGDILNITCFSDIFITVLSHIAINNQVLAVKFISCVDADGNPHAIVEIGDQIWMAENLKYLPEVFPPDDKSEGEPRYYVYGYNGTNVAEAKASDYYKMYGVLYNWTGASAGSQSSNENPSGVQGVCPEGWHLPSDLEWQQLEIYLGMNPDDGPLFGSNRGTNEASKLAGEHDLWTSGELINDQWFSSTAFKAIPAGANFDIGFSGSGIIATWHSATLTATVNQAIDRYMIFDKTELGKYGVTGKVGRSIRCVRN